MRCRTGGSSANRTICWMSCLAAVVGRVRLAGDDDLHRTLGVAAAARVSRSGSRSMRVSRLYDGTRRANPIVSTSGSKHVVDPAELGLARPALQPRDADPAADLVAPAARAASRRTPQICVVGHAWSMPSQSRAVARPAPAPTSRSASSITSRAIQVGACTPLVIERDRHLGRVEARPQRAEHLAAHDAVQQRHAVGALAEPQAHVRHVEDASGRPRRRARGCARTGTPA